VNETPSNISLSNSTVAENQPSGATVGTFSTADPDAGNTFTYTLVSGAGSTDNGSFSIIGNSLRTAAMFDYETKSSYTVRVRTTDQGGLSYEKAFIVSIADEDERPTLSILEMTGGTNVVLRWNSMPNNTYAIHYTTNLLHGFSVLSSNISATPPMNTYTDTVHGVKQKFWRVIVEE
jgi:hypothetical protein